MKRQPITDVPALDAILMALYLAPADIDGLIMRIAAAANVVEIDARAAWGEYISDQLAQQVSAGMVNVINERAGARVFAINCQEYAARVSASAQLNRGQWLESVAASLNRLAIAVERCAAARERTNTESEAAYDARILAHAYTRDSKPPDEVVARSLTRGAK